MLMAFNNGQNWDNTALSYIVHWRASYTKFHYNLKIVSEVECRHKECNIKFKASAWLVKRFSSNHFYNRTAVQLI